MPAFAEPIEVKKRFRGVELTSGKKLHPPLILSVQAIKRLRYSNSGSKISKSKNWFASFQEQPPLVAESRQPGLGYTSIFWIQLLNDTVYVQLTLYQLHCGFNISHNSLRARLPGQYLAEIEVQADHFGKLA